ncbi:MAG: hypothetical protein R3E95_12370 [Thiolinea sp.]
MTEGAQYLRADFAQLYETLAEQGYVRWLDDLPQQLQAVTFDKAHGKRDEWLAALAGLPALQPSSHAFDQDRVRIGTAGQGDAQQLDALRRHLEVFIPK